jgi:hypothetical protein
MPYEMVRATTADTSHGFVSWTPYPAKADSKSQPIGRRYNPEMIQITKPVDWIFVAVASDFFVFVIWLQASPGCYAVYSLVAAASMSVSAMCILSRSPMETRPIN